MSIKHVSVLLNEVAANLDNLKNGGICIDCTVGGGGHSLEILKKYPTVKVIGMDRDVKALKIAEGALSSFTDRIELVQANFADIERVLKERNICSVEAIVADIGMSSFQLEDEKRGFSFESNGPLDMRMGLNEKSAYEVVNEYSTEKLADVIYEYGEERFSRRIAKVISERRPISTTFELRDAVVSAIPLKARKGWKKSVTRVFQAIRIEVNGELNNLKMLLNSAKNLLRKDGRIAVISFHSLEDRIVKIKFREEGFVALTKKPIVPTEEERIKNPRARSAKLRIAKRV